MERKWWTLIAVCVATFMLLLDVTIVNVALPSIQSDLNASLSSLQWVVDAYALTLASFLLVFGSLGDRLGRRRIFSRRVRGLHGRLAALRARQGPDRPQLLPRAAGHRRRGHVRHRPRPDRAGVRGPRARQGDRHLGRDARRRRGDRAADRRRGHGRPRLGVDLLHQRPDRPRRDRDHGAAARERRGHRPSADRLARRGHLLALALRPDLRPDPRQRGGLGLAR